MANSCTYNSVDLGGASYNLVIEENEFARMSPAPRMNRQALSAADGEASQGASFGAREGIVRGVISASSYSALRTLRDNLVSALAVGQEGAKALVFDAISGKQWNARVTNLAFMAESAGLMEVVITFYAAQPWAVATSETASADTATTAGGTTV